MLASMLLAALLQAAGPGFRSRRQFEEHFAKHGAEFGRISQQEYLLRAQALRDAPAGGQILEAVTPDGIVSRFDRHSGAFGAYNRDGTIRTFFIPNAGERYFHRQAQKRGSE
jgi:pyocin large subunit-like protein